MRTVPLVASAVIGGAAVGLVLFFMGNLVDIRVEIQRAPTDGMPQPAEVASGLSEPMPSSATSVGDQPSTVPLSTPRQIVDRAKELTTAGRLGEAQELFLEVLLVNPDNREAMRGLVRVRGLMAGQDAPTLRQQAKTYRRAISQGIETDEHYTAVAMDLLATASLLAVADLQDSTVKTRSQPAPPKPEPTRVTREPVPKPQPVLKAEQATTSKPKRQTVPSKPKPQAQRKPTAVVQTPPSPPAPEAPKPVQRPPSPPAPPASLTVESEPPVDMNEPFVTITIGPIDSGAQASSITTELTVAGYVARMRRDGAQYFITMGPYRQTVAERIASRIRARFGRGVSVTLNQSSNN